MLYPSIFNENLFDDLMDFHFPEFRDFENIDKKLYGRHAAHVMKTDVHEHEDCYEVDIDLPGFKKEEITLNLENGYLVIGAAKGLDKDEKTKKGRLIRQEDTVGSTIINVQTPQVVLHNLDSRFACSIAIVLIDTNKYIKENAEYVA